MLGRYAEDPPVVVEAETAEDAARLAIELGLPVRPGYREGGALIPTPVPEGS